MTTQTAFVEKGDFIKVDKAISQIEFGCGILPSYPMSD